jgi:hypothetical protein
MMVIRLVIDFLVIGEDGTKRGCWWEKWWVVRRRGLGTARFCGLCVYLDVFLLL